jgi:uncharacterized protein YkwD
MRTRRRLAALCLAAAAAVVATGCEFNTEAAQMRGHINDTRAQNGRGALAGHAHLDNRATAVAARMRDAWVAAGCPDKAGTFLVHTGDLVAFYQPDVAVGSWQRVGENIGVTGIDAVAGDGRTRGVTALHNAYLNSPRHRDNVLGTYTHVGVGYATGPSEAQRGSGGCANRDANSMMFNAQVFVK